MKRQTVLSMFCDDATGDYGFAHQNSIDKGFNAFYNGIGIFHDIFEHWFEGVHKHFTGNNEFNIGGEVAAMGAMAYYTGEMYVENRFFNRWHSRIDTIIGGTDGMFYEGINEGYANFCDNGGLITIPYQKPVDSNTLYNVIREHKYKLAEQKKKGYRGDYSDKEYAKQFANSAQGWKLERLYRWGYKMAEKMVHNNDENNYTLSEFIVFWDNFTKNVSAEDLSRFVSKLEINVYTGENLRWTAFFITKEGHRINVKHVDCIEDFYQLYDDE